MKSYLKLAANVFTQGLQRSNRTGVDTLSLFGATLEHNMSEGMPVLTTKKVNFRACIHELLWFLRGDTNIKYLTDNNVHIWDDWADENGDLGPIYGKQWIESGPKKVNQVDYLIKEIRENPLSRRLILDAWSPSDLKEQALPPCHILYQFYAEPNQKNLSLQVYMRSADIFLGLPFDIAEGGLLLHLVSSVTGYTPLKLRYVLGDAHIYVNHLEQMRTQLGRECFSLPRIEINKKESIYDYTIDDIKLVDYKSHSFLKGDVAV